jgi:hemerythrin superfamily protein
MKIVCKINKMSIYYLPIENNVFDGLYKKIMDIDNDIIDTNAKYFNRNIYINCFLKMLDDVNEKEEKSIYYRHYKLSNSIDIFYRTIVSPMLEFGIEETKPDISFSILEKNKGFFSVYTHESWMDNIFREELLLKYFLEFEHNNQYITEHGLFEISTEKTITPIQLPFRDKKTNELCF